MERMRGKKMARELKRTELTNIVYGSSFYGGGGGGSSEEGLALIEADRKSTRLNSSHIH